VAKSKCIGPLGWALTWSKAQSFIIIFFLFFFSSFLLFQFCPWPLFLFLLYFFRLLPSLTFLSSLLLFVTFFSFSILLLSFLFLFFFSRAASFLFLSFVFFFIAAPSFQQPILSFFLEQQGVAMGQGEGEAGSAEGLNCCGLCSRSFGGSDGGSSGRCSKGSGHGWELWVAATATTWLGRFGQIGARCYEARRGQQLILLSIFFFFFFSS
jgi:hypothetical protein